MACAYDVGWLLDVKLGSILVQAIVLAVLELNDLHFMSSRMLCTFLL